MNEHNFVVHDSVKINNNALLLNGYSGMIESINRADETAEVIIWSVDKTITVKLSDLIPFNPSYLLSDDEVNDIISRSVPNFKLKDRVKIINDKSKYYDCVGTLIHIDTSSRVATIIISPSNEQVTVRLDDLCYFPDEIDSRTAKLNRDGTIEIFDGEKQISDARLKFQNFISKNNYDAKNDLIYDKILFDLVYSYFLDIVPKYFYIVSASSSGKYHPKYSNMPSGLMYHTMQTVKIAKNLLKSSLVKSIFNIYTTYPNMRTSELNDIVISALLIHDTFKLGHVKGDYTVYSHPNIAAAEFYNHGKKYIEKNKSKFSDDGCAMLHTIKMICAAVERHMGDYGMTDCDECISKFVSLCDYLSAQKLFEQMYDYDGLTLLKDYF